MGTPEFAVPTLKMLIEKHEVVMCVTKTDKPRGRKGNTLVMPPVKELALQYGIPVYQPEKANTDEFYDTLKNAGADIFVTCAYGKILPARVLEIPKYGCVNVHASLLPEYRGAAPLWHVVIDGKKESGITTMLTDAGMDTGDILRTDTVPIGPDMTMGELHDVLSELGPVTLEETLKDIENGTAVRTKQDGSRATYSPMVDRETGHIDWSRDALSIHNLVRGCNPTPVAYTTSDGQRMKIWRTKLIENESVNTEPGRIEIKGKTLTVFCGRGSLEVLEIQAEGSRMMTTGEYLNGHTPCRFE